MSSDGSASTAMLGLPGLVLLAVAEVDGELEQAVQTTVSTAWCEGCGVVAKPHGRRPVRVRELPCAGRPVTLLWLKRLWRCPEPACAVRTWSEACAHMRPWASLTDRARQEAWRLVGQDGLNVVAVAAALGVVWGTVMRAVDEHGAPLVDDPRRLAGVVAVGVDETAFLAARRGQHPQFVTGIVAETGPGQPRAQLLDVVPGRTEAAVQDWFSAATRPGETRSTPPRSTRSAATRPQCWSAYRARCGCWTPSTSSSSDRPRWMRCAAPRSSASATPVKGATRGQSSD